MTSSAIILKQAARRAILITFLILTGCRTPDRTPNGTVESSVTLPATVVLTPTPVPIDPEALPGDGLELTAHEIATLSSLRKVDNYPLYTMNYVGGFESIADLPDQHTSSISHGINETWGCSLFAAFGDSDNSLYGRNFDWRFSPALLLFMDPPDKYASVSMVDIEYLGFEGVHSNEVDNLPLEERANLLDAPRIPFDGMNEMGLVVGMAAVPPGGMESDPGKENIGSLGVIREMLDKAANTQEAVEIMSDYNVDMGSGPPLHYLIADAAGEGALVEFYQGEMVVVPNNGSYHRATNFIRSAEGESAEGACWRYDALGQRLEETGATLTKADAMKLLESVSQPNTQWSVVYGMQDGEVLVTMGRNYERQYTFDSDGNLKQ